MATSSFTGWAMSIGTRVSLLMDGTFIDTGTRVPVLVSPDETFVSGDAVAYAVARANVRIIGSHVSPIRLAAAVDEFPRPQSLGVGALRRESPVMTLRDVLAHPTFGVKVPSIDTIIAANTLEEEQAA